LIVLLRLAADYEVFDVLMMTSLNCEGEKEFQIFSVSEVTELWNLNQNSFLKNLFFCSIQHKMDEN